jgi:hypothetical protein
MKCVRYSLFLKIPQGVSAADLFNSPKVVFAKLHHPEACFYKIQNQKVILAFVGNIQNIGFPYVAWIQRMGENRQR